MAVPVAVLAFGWLLLALLAVVVPLAAPAVWSGAAPTAVAGELIGLIRRRLLTVALLMAAVSLLAGAVGAVMSFIVLTGGRVVAELGVAVVGVDVPAQQLMAGLFGYGLRSLGAARARRSPAPPMARRRSSAAASCSRSLVLPGLVYLRACVRSTWRCAGGRDRDAAACRPALDGQSTLPTRRRRGRPCPLRRARATIAHGPLASRWSRCWRSSTRSAPCRSTSTSRRA